MIAEYFLNTGSLVVIAIWGVALIISAIFVARYIYDTYVAKGLSTANIAIKDAIFYGIITVFMALLATYLPLYGTREKLQREIFLSLAATMMIDGYVLHVFCCYIFGLIHHHFRAGMSKLLQNEPQARRQSTSQNLFKSPLF